MPNRPLRDKSPPLPRMLSDKLMVSPCSLRALPGLGYLSRDLRTPLPTYGVADWIEADRPTNITGEISAFFHALKWVRDTEASSSPPHDRQSIAYASLETTTSKLAAKSLAVNEFSAFSMSLQSACSCNFLVQDPTEALHARVGWQSHGGSTAGQR